MEGIWGRLVSDLPRGVPRAAFLLIQHMAMVGALGERGVTGGDEHTATLASHTSAMATFVEAALEVHLRGWTAWVKKVEADTAALLQGGGGGAAGGGGGAAKTPLTPQQLLASLPEGTLPPIDAEEAEGAVKELALTWRTALSSLNDEVTRYTPVGGQSGGGAGAGGAGAGAGGSKNAMAVLKAVFSKLAEYHQRGEALLGRAYAAAPPAWLRELVPLQNIYYEMRRFGREEGGR